MSEKLKANISGAQQAERNANDGISMLQTAEGGLNGSGFNPLERTFSSIIFRHCWGQRGIRQPRISKHEKRN